MNPERTNWAIHVKVISRRSGKVVQQRAKSTPVVEFVADESEDICSSQQSSVAFPDTLTAIKKDKSTPWWYRLFGRPMHHHKQKQSPATTDAKQATQKRKTKIPLWLTKRRHRIAPAPQDEVVEQERKKKTEEVQKENKKTLRHQQIKCLGFPNPAQICYLNSCLQSLLTLEDFVKAIVEQEQVWSLIPEAAIMRSFIDINRSHLSSDERHKIWLLAAFKGAISARAPEFQDLHQKDAHEFLTSVLEQMRCLGPELQMMAASVGGTYSCPVTEHMVFKMNNTRTCKSCGAESTREEEFTNLSLDLVPGRSTVEDLLQNYLIEKELEYTCECGATMSGQRSSFQTVPRVLVLHLKRFRFTPTYQPEKIQDPVVLLRHLMVSSNQGGVCYSLVSTISHIGSTTTSGHYICDGVDPDLGPEDPTDRWFTYNDAKVTETSSGSVCEQRERDAYILFYKRHD